MNRIIIAALTLLITTFVSSCYAMESDFLYLPSKNYSQLKKLSCETANFRIRTFVADDFTEDTIRCLFSGGSKEYLIGAFKQSKNLCFGVFKKDCQQCIGTVTLLFGKYIDNSFGSLIKLGNTEKKHELEIRRELNLCLQSIINQNRKCNIHYLEIFFVSAADITDVETVGFIHYDSTKGHALTLKSGTSLQAGHVLYYYPLQDSNSAANSAQSDAAVARSWWPCFPCCVDS